MSKIIFNEAAVDAVKNFKTPEEIGFGKVLVPAMLNSYYDGSSWGDIHFLPYANLLIDPAAKVLHYAQEIFEGLKAYKGEDGDLYLFRPTYNAKRFAHSAVMMGMPNLPEEHFIESIKALVKSSSHLIGQELGDSFYLRPFMFGDEPQLGVKASKTYQYYLIGGPAGSYFSGDMVKVRVERDYHRVASHGTGTAKTGGNYAASLSASNKTYSIGYDQTIWLDPIEGKYVEELSGMNFMAVIDNTLVTPRLSDSILHGVTRDSLLKIASSLGIDVVERDIDINEMLEQIDEGHCTETFACGTASVISPIGQFIDNDREYVLNQKTTIAKQLKEKLQHIQTGRCEDQFGWRYKV